MPTTGLNRIGRAFNLLADAVAVSAAVRDRRKPDERNLRGLGIDPEQFNTIVR